MATPLVAGCAALVREYYIKDRKHEPSAALLKATLINSTKWLRGQGSIAQYNRLLRNYHQEFGFVYMPQAIFNKSNQIKYKGIHMLYLLTRWFWKMLSR
jgi:serine protease AprX